MNFFRVLLCACFSLSFSLWLVRSFSLFRLIWSAGASVRESFLFSLYFICLLLFFLLFFSWRCPLFCRAHLSVWLSLYSHRSRSIYLASKSVIIWFYLVCVFVSVCVDVFTGYGCSASVSDRFLAASTNSSDDASNKQSVCGPWWRMGAFSRRLALPLETRKRTIENVSER